MLRLGIVQMSSTPQVEDNLRFMRDAAEKAAKGGAKLVVFPEMAYQMGTGEQCRPSLARFDELLGRFAGWAKELGVHLVPGSLREPVAPGDSRSYNTLPVLGPDGKLVARYRKVFLFRASLPGDRIYDERKDTEPGQDLVTFAVDGITVGLSICFDLRFPELFRALRRRDAQLILLPAAFTAITGAAHWETLVRARAIENQAFVATAAQTGLVGEGKPTYGHSGLVAPWGELLADLGTEPGVGIVDVDVTRIRDAQSRVAAWDSRREDLFPLA